MTDSRTEKEKLSQRYAKLSSEQRQALQARLSGDKPASHSIQILPRTYPLPASFFQESLWLQQEFEANTVAYNLPVAFRLVGSLNTEALDWAINQIINRHEILRTTFSLIDGHLIQIIAPELELGVARIDLSSCVLEDRHHQVEHIIREEAQNVFDLEKGPLLRTTLIRLTKTEHIVSLCMHHIISDGVSKDILATELVRFYTAFFQRKSEPCEPLPLQYADFALWQRHQFAEGRLRPQLEYWLKQLSHLPASLSLPVDKPYLPERQVEGERVFFSFDKDLYAKVKMFCQQEGVTLFMFLIAVFKVLLFRYSGQEDIVIGTPVSNRKFKELEKLIGFFTNTLVLRSWPQGDMPFHAFLQALKQTALDAYRHQDLPYEKLVSALQPERFANQSAIFQSMFIFQKEAQEHINIQDLSVSHFFAEDNGAKFDLSLVAVENTDTIECYIEYATDLFFEKTIESMGNHFIQLVQNAIQNPQCPLQSIVLLTDDEKKQIIKNAAGPKVSHDLVKGIHQLFEEQAIKTPAEIAIVCGSSSLSFGALNAKANQLAYYLKDQGATSETLIGICVGRSLEMMIGLLAVLKSGAAYVPLDPSYPKARLAHILHDSKLNMLLTEERFCPQFDVLNEATQPRVCMDLKTLLPDLINYSTDNLNLPIADNQLAYVIYTSGSTGKPKGVMVEHRHVENFMLGMDNSLGPNVGTWLAATSISFDISVLELFWTLSRGFKVVLTESETNATSMAQQKDKTTIDFSLFYFSSVDEQYQDKYQLLIDGAKFADNHGFKAIWTPERHFQKFGGLFPNPSVISAALAMVTKNIQLRAGSCVMPLHHPSRVAEEWAVVDNLSQGRVGISFASGWQPNDFIFAPQHYEARQSILIEHIEKVRALWRGESLKFKGVDERSVDIQIYPRPVQSELPFWLTSSGNPETFRKSGEIGANLLTHLLGQSVDELAEKIQIYRSEFQKHHGHVNKGTVTLMIHTFVSKDEDYVLRQVKEPLKNYLKDAIGLLKPFAEASGKDIKNISKDDLDAVLEHAFSRYYQTNGLFGTPESCMKMIDQLQAIGVDEIACLVDFGISDEIVLKNLSYLNELKEKMKPKAASMPEEIATLMRQHHVTHFQCTPMVAHLLSGNADVKHQLQSLTHMLVGGDDFPLSLANALTKLIKGDVYNMYGPTETTVWSTVKKLSKITDAVSIGKPISNTQAYILDANMQLLPRGILGGLYIGGASVARGYLNQAELTSQRFVETEVEEGCVERLYSTGDLAKYLPDGTLKYMGRNDNQVKIRGFRIELGEIESIAIQHPSVLEAVAVVHEDEQFIKTIVLYYTLVHSNALPNARSAAESIKQFLGQSLPSYMIPVHVFNIAALPLTSNGKIDRCSLVSQEMPLDATIDQHAHVLPRCHEEIILASIWRRILKIKQISIHDNFFNLGGNSILAIEMLSLAREANIHLSPRHIFQYPTIAELITQREIDVARLKNVTLLLPDAQIENLSPNFPFKAKPVQNIFLTGSTGFLGRFILHDLLKTNSKLKLYCLIRATDEQHALSRLKQNLERYGLWNEQYLERVVFILGDISRERFGLEIQQYEDLCCDIDTIVHCAAMVNLVQTYEQLKPTNIEGVQHILKFSCCGALKPVHYISTLKVFSKVTDEKIKYEDADLMHETVLEGGYAQTKWVADQMMLQAREKGLPINIYRPGSVSGSSQTGAWNTQGFACRMLKGCIQLGVVPKTQVTTDFTPVDYVSSAVVHILLDEVNLGQTFHLRHSSLISIRDMVQRAREMGYVLQELSYAEWYQRLIHSLQDEENELHTLIGVFDSDPEFDPWRGEQFEVNDDNTHRALVHTKMTRSYEQNQLLSVYFNYLMAGSFLPMPAKETAAV
ncbi:MAG: thioester reductase domain-containing protein [Gammaproteobacteria bacterium]|nr:thioester reductase domain-containing protein [Gammaproteobacteria bacterium]